MPPRGRRNEGRRFLPHRGAWGKALAAETLSYTRLICGATARAAHRHDHIGGRTGLCAADAVITVLSPDRSHLRTPQSGDPPSVKPPTDGGYFCVAAIRAPFCPMLTVRPP